MHAADNMQPPEEPCADNAKDAAGQSDKNAAKKE
jgi:hypothetical protein